MSFAIRFLSKNEDTPGLGHNEEAIYGQLIMGSFTECFYASLSYWSTADYRCHWQQAIARIIEGHSNSALITDIYDPAHANFITWWPLWRINKRVYIQNQLLMMDELSGAFDPLNPYIHVGKRGTISDEGQKISEWCVPVQSMKSFLESFD